MSCVHTALLWEVGVRRMWTWSWTSQSPPGRRRPAPPPASRASSLYLVLPCYTPPSSALAELREGDNLGRTYLESAELYLLTARCDSRTLRDETSSAAILRPAKSRSEACVRSGVEERPTWRANRGDNSAT